MHDIVLPTAMQEPAMRLTQELLPRPHVAGCTGLFPPSTLMRQTAAALGHMHCAGMLCRAPVQLQGLTRCQAPISVMVRHSEQRSEQILDHSQLHLVAGCCEQELGSLLRLIAGRRSWGHRQPLWAGQCTRTLAHHTATTMLGTTQVRAKSDRCIPCASCCMHAPCPVVTQLKLQHCAVGAV